MHKRRLPDVTAADVAVWRQWRLKDRRLVRPGRYKPRPTLEAGQGTASGRSGIATGSAASTAAYAHSYVPFEHVDGRTHVSQADLADLSMSGINATGLLPSSGAENPIDAHAADA